MHNPRPSDILYTVRARSVGDVKFRCPIMNPGAGPDDGGDSARGSEMGFVDECALFCGALRVHVSMRCVVCVFYFLGVR